MRRSPRPARPGAGRWRPRVHLASVLGRARSDAMPLALTFVVVALVAFASGVVPTLDEQITDAALSRAVTDAGADAGVAFVVPLREDAFAGGARDPDAATQTEQLAAALQAALLPELDATLADPVSTLVSTPFAVQDAPARLGRTSLALGYVAAPTTPGVRWLEGGPPVSTLTPAEVSAAPITTISTVEVGLSDAAAALLGVATGDHVSVRNAKVALDVLVSGVFRPDDPADPAWSHVPGLVDPGTTGTGDHARTVLVGLVSTESLRGTILTMPVATMARTVTFDPLSAAVDRRSAEVVAGQLAGLRASAYSLPGGVTAVRSTLDTVLRDELASVRATRAQASVLLAGTGSVAALTILMTAHLLARRRAGVLRTSRARGASLVDVAAEHAVESVVLTGLAAATGLVVASLVVPGASPRPWMAPALLAVALVAPVVAVRSAAPAEGRRPANAQARRRAATERRVRRLVLEGGVVVAGVGAMVALRGRGVVASVGEDGDPLVAAAPTLLALAVALVLVRGLPFVLDLVLRRSVRSRHAVPVLAAARARATASSVVPFVALSLACTLAVFAAVLLPTVQRGQVASSWAAVGGDVRVTGEPDAALIALAERVAAAEGVDAVATGLVLEDVQLSAGWGSQRVRLVVVRTGDLGRYLAHVPIDGVDVPDGLEVPVPGGSLPVLVSPDLAARGGPEATLLWDREPVPVVATGATPALDDLGTGTVLVDEDAFVAATGAAPVPSTLWVTGGGAESAVASVPDLAGPGTTTSRAQWLDALRTAPLSSGLVSLVAAAAALLLAAAVLVVVLAASASAPHRGSTLAALRTLGLSGRGARRITLGELAPPVLVASVTGMVTGVGLALAVAGPTALRLVTHQAVEPVIVVPWWIVALPLVLLAAVLVVVAAESSLRRRERLGEVLRAGTP